MTKLSRLNNLQLRLIQVKADISALELNEYNLQQEIIRERERLVKELNFNREDTRTESTEKGRIDDAKEVN